MSKHTPGPWRAVHHGYNLAIRAGDIIDPLAYFPNAESFDPAATEANARLIAAAPELLAALRLCVLKFSQLLDTGMTLGMARALDEARAAIAKAEGQS